MADNLNLNRGGGLTGSSILQDTFSSGSTPDEFSVDIDPPKPPELPRKRSFLEKDFSEFTGREKFLWVLKSGLMGGKAAMKQRQQIRGAARARQKEAFDATLSAIKAVEPFKDNPHQYAKLGKALEKRLRSSYGAEVADSFINVFEEPAIAEHVLLPSTIQEFGTMESALAANEDNPEDFRQRVITANIGDIESELLRLRQESPDLVKLDSNKNGQVTASEARDWIRKRMKAKDTNLTMAQMNIIQFPEFERHLTDMFDAIVPESIRKQQEATERQKNAIVIQAPDGRQGLSFDGGRTFTPKGAKEPIPTPGGSITGTIKGTPDEFSVSKKEFGELRASEISTLNAMQISDRLIQQVQVNPDVLSVGGTISVTLDTLKSQAESLARISGIPIKASSDPSKYDFSHLENTAQNTAGFRSNVTAMAFAAAAASGQTGRSVSNRDVQRFIDQVGGGAGSPAQFAAAMGETRRFLEMNFKNRYRVLTGKDYEGPIGGPPSNAKTAAEIEGMSDAEFQEFGLSLTAEILGQLPKETKDAIRARINKRGK